MSESGWITLIFLSGYFNDHLMLLILWAYKNHIKTTETISKYAMWWPY